MNIDGTFYEDTMEKYHLSSYIPNGLSPTLIRRYEAHIGLPSEGMYTINYSKSSDSLVTL